MTDLELLELISKGRTQGFLLQKDISAKLNLLSAKKLIDICDGKINLTAKGDQFQKDMKIALMEDIELQKRMEEFSQSTFKRNSMFVYLSLIILCIAAFFLSLLILQGN